MPGSQDNKFSKKRETSRRTRIIAGALVLLAMFATSTRLTVGGGDQGCVQNEVGLQREQRLLDCATRSALLDRYDEAIAYTDEALKIVAAIPDRNIHNVDKNAYIGRLFNNLGFLYYAKGDYRKALDYFTLKRKNDVKVYAARGLETVDGNPPIEFADDLFHLGLTYQGLGEIDKALDYFYRANEKEDETLFDDFFHDLSEPQKLEYVRILSYLTDTTISLHMQTAPSDARAARLALQTVFRRKGRVLDLLSSDFDLIKPRLTPRDRATLIQYITLRVRRQELIKSLQHSENPTQQLDSIHQLDYQLRNSEHALKRNLDYIYRTWEPETVESIQAAIPAGSALVEFVLYRPFNAKAVANNARWSESHYVAYVLHHTGEPQALDLGPSKVIDDRVGVWRKELQNDADDVSDTGVRRAAQALNDLIMRPLGPLINKPGGLVFVAPDGMLNLVPFAALVDEHNHYLIENFTFNYLTSGRDLLRSVANSPRGGRPMIVADADFNEAGRTENDIRMQSSATMRREPSTCLSTEFTGGGWVRLQGFLDEEKAIKRQLPSARVLIGRNASEESIKGMKGPTILHIATHGEFLPDAKVSTTALSPSRVWFGLLRPTTGRFDPNEPDPENMLLRSYVALAGANLDRGDESDTDCNDGILTALELARVNLWGTRVVVLSACQTGLGDVANGEGVYGLRRALIIAGSQSQLITLWSIDDQSTVELMANYYRFLRRGLSRAESLRQSQLLFLKPERQELIHPYYWAAFVPSGLWTKLDLDHF